MLQRARSIDMDALAEAYRKLAEQSHVAHR